MILNKDKVKTILIYVLVIMLVICLWIQFNRPINNQVNDISKLKYSINMLNINIKYYDSILIKLKFKTDSILTTKTKIITKYEDRIKEIRNANIVSNDSITKYISSKLHNR